MRSLAGRRQRGRDGSVELAAPPAPFPPLLTLVHEDDDVLVIDKPAGLLTISTESERERTAYRLLRALVGRARPGPNLRRPPTRS